MKVQILKRFVDNRIGLLAPGERDLKDNDAQRLIQDGRAVALSSDQTAETPSAPPVETVESDIPDDFPSRNLLIQNGITSLDQLKDPATLETLDQIQGIGPATLEKIKVAIAGLLEQ